ncbi:glycosyltransferase [Alkalihalobacillus sp. MEB130]|nr:glycosyltransferase [Alkalihalobacillus sp. MEB130]
MEIKQTDVHFIISPSPWEQDPLQYRRHRLANYLIKESNTKAVYWIAPKPSSIKSLFLEPEVKVLNNGIIQILVRDFKSFIRYVEPFQSRVKKKIIKTERKSSNLYLWYTYPAFSSLTNLNMWQKIIYDCSDYWREAEQVDNNWMNTVKREMIIQSEKRIVKASDICFASSKHLSDHLYKLKHKNIFLLENGVDFELFQKRKKKPINAKPILGFVGGLKPWKIDFSLLLEVARKQQDWEIVLIGSSYGQAGKAFKDLLAQRNVTIYDSVPFSDIPEYLSTFDVGLLPYLDNEYNQGVFPLKFFEYLASDLPIVGCGIPSTKHYEEEGIYEQTKNNSNYFIDACLQALKNRDINKEKRLTLAKSSDWNEKIERMLKELRR